MYLALFTYNNYYNRIVKRQETVADYVMEASYVIGSVDNINFNPNDGITTSAIVNLPTAEKADYAILVGDDGTTIISRWYVIETTRTRAGQYNLSLLRDVIADYYNEVIAAPTFIEKATLSTNNPLIFNNENMTYNQIKTSETLLMDETKTPWIVGYVANSLESKPISTAAANVVVNYPNYTSWDAYEFAQYDEEHPYVGEYNDFTYMFYFQENQNDSTVAAFFDENNNPAECLLPIDASTVIGSPYLYDIDVRFIPKSGMWRKIFVSWAAVGQGVSAGASLNEFDFKELSYAYSNVSRFRPEIASEGGKIIQIGDKYYEIIVNTRISEPKVISVANSDPNISHWDDIVYNMDDVLDLNNTNNTSPHGGFAYTAWEYVVDKREIDISSVDFTIGADRAKLNDAPYAMFAMPAQDIGFSVGGGAYTSNSYLTYRLVQNMIVALDSELYDIQLLPYCPLTDLTVLSGNLLIPGTEDTDYVLIKDENNNIASFLLWLGNSSFSRTLNYTIPKAASAIDLKVQSECDKYRIVSPTYNGEFEFSAAKNGGVSGFNVFCSYKPFNPLIKVAPIFGGLYGKEFQDGRGCICQGDFSLPQINDQWVSYQINNKNYLNAFNRQIENMEINNAYQFGMDIANAVGGALSAAGTGAAAGFMAGGGIGAAIGGIGGFALSAGAGIADVIIGSKLREESLDYTKDQFGYQLGNIQALPYTLANIGAQTILSKLYPFLEYYTATDTEKEALRDKVKYNGMTVMKIGTIAEYIHPNEKTYIKGKLIRLEDAPEEFHFVNTIANEITQGVFI